FTRHYHLEDIAATRVHHHLVPGEGAIDFAATLRAIRATGYDGWITIELYPYVDDPDAAARTALERVSQIMATFGTRCASMPSSCARPPCRRPWPTSASARSPWPPSPPSAGSPRAFPSRSSRSCCSRRPACTRRGWSGTITSTWPRTGASVL